MADINPNLPAVNEPNSTADPKILSALSTLVSTVNNLESANLSSGAVTLEKLAADITDLLVPVGSLMDYSGSSDPIAGKWILADGRELSRATYATLFSLLGGASSPYGVGDGSTTFNIPDLRGRAAVAPDSMGTAKGDADRLPDNDTRGAAAGTATAALSTSHIPQFSFTPGGSVSGSVSGAGTHGHGLAIGGIYHSAGGTYNAITVAGGNNYTLFRQDIGVTGDGGHSHSWSGSFSGNPITIGQASPTSVDRRQPYVVVNKIIRVS